MIIKEGKTNIKYLFIVIILAVLVGGGILTYQYWWLPKEEAKIREIKPSEEKVPPLVEVSDITSKDLVFDTETVWLADQNANIILSILPLTRDVNNSQSPLLVYDSNAKAEIIDFLKKLIPSP